MGLYIYSIRSPKHRLKLRLEDGSYVTAAAYAFAYKPCNVGWMGSKPRWETLAGGRIQRMENIWARWANEPGHEMPTHGVMVSSEDGKLHPDSRVMRFPGMAPCCYDDYSFGGATWVGKVEEVLDIGGKAVHAVSS